MKSKLLYSKNTNVVQSTTKENGSDSKILATRYINDLKEKKQACIISEGTYKSYKSAIVIFLKFAKMYYGTENTCIKAIDKQFFFISKTI